jgi:Flp pilus assembly protein TadG
MTMQSKHEIAREARGLISSLVRYLRGRHGAVTPIMALALIPIIGAMGMGAEASNWWLTQRSAQNAADAAAMAAAVDAGGNYSGTSGASKFPSDTTCATATTTTTSWYCQAKAAAAKYNFVDGASNVTVRPLQVSCTRGGSTATCVQVTIQKAVPLYLLNVIGYSGSTTIGGAKYQKVVAVAQASLPGPPVDFCMITLSSSSGAFHLNGAPKGALGGCNVFSNGTNTCDGGSSTPNWGINYAYEAGTSTNKTCGAVSNPDKQTAITDPYTAMDTALDTLDKTNPCTSPASATGSSILNSNVISATTISNAVSSAGGGTAIVTVCGNARLGNSSGTSSCTSAVNYSGSVNVEIIVVGGSLDMYGCTLATVGTGGMTVMFAPSYTASVSKGVTTYTVNGTCPSSCYPVDTVGGGVIDIAAPTSGTYSGFSLIQSNKFTASSALNMTYKGNNPTLKVQGGIYMPNATMDMRGAIDFHSNGLQCISVVANQILVDGNASIFNNNGVSLTSQCTQAGLNNLPTVPGTHTYFQALVG